MKRFLALLVVMASMSGSAIAETPPLAGDYFLIARNTSGSFIGSHKVFTKLSVGTRKVQYCAYSYYVRGSTIAWSQIEARRGHIIRLEYNSGRGWRPICASPEQQVTLKDIGVKLSPQDYLNSLEENPKQKNLLASIKSFFGTDEPEEAEAEGSYHER